MAEESKPAIRVEQQPHVIIVYLLVKDLDEIHANQVRAELQPVIAQFPGMPFILDMSPVKFIPSLTLGMLVNLYRAFHAREQKLILASVQSIVRQVFVITHLDRILEIHPTVDDAVKSIVGAGH